MNTAIRGYTYGWGHMPLIDLLALQNQYIMETDK